MRGGVIEFRGVRACGTPDFTALPVRIARSTLRQPATRPARVHGYGRPMKAAWVMLPGPPPGVSQRLARLGRVARKKCMRPAGQSAERHVPSGQSEACKSPFQLYDWLRDTVAKFVLLSGKTLRRRVHTPKSCGNQGGHPAAMRTASIDAVLGPVAEAISDFLCVSQESGR